MSEPALEKLPKEATGAVRFGEAKPGFPESTVVKDQPVPAAPATKEKSYDEKMLALREGIPGAHNRPPVKIPKRRQLRSAPVTTPAPTIVDPEKGYGPSGMGLYDTGVEKVRAEHGDEAADAARKDMAHADFMRARKEYGEMKSSSDDHYERVETGDDQTWLVNKDTGEVNRVTGMSDEDVDRAYYPETQPEASG